MEVQQYTKQQQVFLAKLQQAALDMIRVYNPTDEDFLITWNSTEIWRIPNKNKDSGYGKGNRVVPRYIYANYITHMTDHILTKESDDYIEALNKEREKKGIPRLSHAERYRIEPRTNDMGKRKEVFRKLFIRIEEEHGVDLEVKKIEIKPVDSRPMDVQLMEEVEMEKSGIPVPQVEEVPTLPNAKPMEVDDALNFLDKPPKKT